MRRDQKPAWLRTMSGFSLAGDHTGPHDGGMPRAGPIRGAGAAPGAWRTLAWGQGGYFLLTGVWPIAHIRSFMAVTGPKTDLWLVRLVGAMIAVAGAVLLDAAWRGRLERPTVWVGLGMPIVLGAVDVIYVANGTIPPIYLLDAAAEAVLAGWWVVVLVALRRDRAG